MRQLAITAIGEDRPGIVAGVCRVRFEAGGNLRDTSMTILSGQFAMILIVAVPRALEVAQLEKLFEPARRELGIALIIRELPEGQPMPSGRPEVDGYLVTVAGADKPGIVYRVAEEMARHGINITDLNTRILAEDRQPVYLMMMEVIPPPDVNMDQLGHQLAEIGRRLSVEVQVRPLDTAAL
jgi:glycine cleavage system transcriptional repressor